MTTKETNFFQIITKSPKVAGVKMHLFSSGYFSCYFEEYGEKKMELTEELKLMIEGHLEKFPNVSINALAHRSGVGATTLRRILNLSIKGEPSPHTILSLASVVYKEKKII